MLEAIFADTKITVSKAAGPDGARFDWETDGVVVHVSFLIPHLGTLETKKWVIGAVQHSMMHRLLAATEEIGRLR